MTPPLLRAVSLSKRFGSHHAVRPLDLEIGAGEYFCILGPSGSGKSTLLRLLGGFEVPDSGEIYLGGERIDRLPPELRDANTVFQGYALFPHLSVQENVAFGLRMKRVKEGELQERVSDALRLVGLAEYAARSPGSLSGGERQRVALARALVNRPRVLLLDEPLAALDRKLRLRMQEELSRIQAEIGIAFIHVTHDQEEALRLADRVAVMNRGRFLQVGRPEEVYRRPRTPFVADFLGATNLIRARTVSVTPPEVHLSDCRIALRVAEGSTIPPVGEEGMYAVRPSSLRIERFHEMKAHPEGGEFGGGRSERDRDWGNSIAGEVLSRRPLGDGEELRVRVGQNLDLIVHTPTSPGGSIPDAGEKVLLFLDPGNLLHLESDGDEDVVDG